MLKEPLQSPIGRGRLRRTGTFAGEVAEVHGARADHADDDHAQRLDAALAQGEFRTQNPGEGGDSAVKHGAFPWSESPSRIDLAALNQPCVV